MTFSRKLVSIMFTDIVGYTKLMQKSEATAVALRKRHRDVIDYLHKKYNGKVIQYLGDGSLSTFESTIESVLCAIEIQQLMNQDTPIPLRIGMHLGDVIITESDIIGNSVNIASRVESLGVAGTILISNKVREEIQNQNIAVKLMGTYHFKNDLVPRDIYAVEGDGIYVPDPAELSGKLKQNGKNDHAVAKQKENSAAIQLENQVIGVINQNLANPDFSVEVLCREIGYSRPQLYRKLKAIRGLSPSELIRETRLQKAAGLLKDRAGNVSEIAFRTGFNNLSYFSKAFHERFGTSPSDYTRDHGAKTNTPVTLTKLIGRDNELSEIISMFMETRLLTLTGPGGTGKTRLALEFLKRIGHTIRNGAHFVQLAPVVDHQQVLPKIAQVLRIQQDPTKDNIELIVDSVGQKELLLVLDNFEHVLEAAPYVNELLLACSNLKIITTSRTVLNLPGEQEYSVPQLSLPSSSYSYTPAELSKVHAIQLFLDRVKNVKPAFVLNDENKQVITDICSNLDGLPLALELAAARMKIFSPEALLRRLSGNLDILKSNAPQQPDRHRTLRNAIDWSYSLLAPEEQTLFRRLSIFSGGCTIEAAEVICFHDYVQNLDIIDVFASLVDKSLLQREDQPDGEPRFFMLETLKAFGQDRLQKALEKNQITDRYVNFYSDKLKDSDRHLTGSSQRSWLDQIDIELDNIRAVLSYFEKEGKSNEGLEFAVSFWRFWAIRTMMREGSDWFNRMLAIPTLEPESIIRCKALNSYGVLFGLTQKVLNALNVFEQSLVMARNLDYQQGIAQALKYISWIHYFQCNFELYEKYSTEALELHQQLGNTRDIASIHNNTANTSRIKGNLIESLHLHQQAANLMRSIGDMRGYAYNLCGIAWLQCFLGNYDQCDLDTEQALNILGEIDDKQLIAFNMSISAFNYCYRKDYDAALEKVELSLPMWQKSGNNYGTVMCDVISGMVYLKTDQTDKFQQVFSRYEDATVETIDKTFLYWEKQLKSRWLVEEGHFDKAFKMTRKNLKNLLDKGIKLILPDELELMAHLLTEKNLTKEAIQFYSYAQDLRSHFKIAVPPIWKQDHTDLSLKLEISSKTHDHPKPNTRQNISIETIITLLETI